MLGWEGGRGEGREGREGREEEESERGGGGRECEMNNGRKGATCCTLRGTEVVLEWDCVLTSAMRYI